MLNGNDLSTVVGIVHVLELMIDESISALQLVKSLSNDIVEVLISSLYPFIVNPPRSDGAFQLIPISNSLLTFVVGGFGYEGTVAATIVKTEE